MIGNSNDGAGYCWNHREVPTCACGQNTICLACNQGHGCLPCRCSPVLDLTAYQVEAAAQSEAPDVR